MKKQYHISLIQMDIQLGKKQVNLNKIESLIIKSTKTVLKSHTHIICLPELCTTGFDLKNFKTLAERIPKGSTTDLFRNLAQKHNVHIIASYIEESMGSYYNCGIIINDQGQLLTKYRKIHLFPLKPMEESEYFTSGDNTNIKSIVNINGLRVGVLICFDLRYPEVSRRLVLEGVDCIIYLAEFPRPRDDVWTTLLRARAMENQVFVIGVNRVGADPEISFFGKSMVIDPKGKTISSGSDKEEIIMSTLNPELLDSAKQFIPTLSLRHPDQY
jgi:predicted amidohydrolase